MKVQFILNKDIDYSSFLVASKERFSDSFYRKEITFLYKLCDTL